MDAPSPFLSALEARLAGIAEVRRREEAANRRSLLRLVSAVVATVVLLAGGTIGVLWVMGNFVSRQPLALFAAALCVWALVGYLAYRMFGGSLRTGDAEAHDLKRAFREQVLLPTLREALPGCEVTTDTLFDQDAVRASRLFHGNFNRLAHTCGFAGQAGGAAFQATVLRIAYREFREPLQPRLGRGGHKRKWNDHRFGHFFSGLLVRIDRPGPFASTVRLADPVYQHRPYGYETARAVNVVLAKTGDAAFDSEFLLVLDQEHPQAPPIPEALRRLCGELSQRFDRPVFLSFTATGIYLAVATGDGRLPLQVEFLEEPAAEVLAEELELIRKAPAAVEVVQRALAAG
ncbi:MAG: hypothetical protein KJZ84_11835 [Bryobacteraceae bacterium]|nr:hypothetical protein [Bryobacteraceae bacterium]